MIADFKSITLIPIFVCKPEDWIIEFMELSAFLLPIVFNKVGGLLHCKNKIKRRNTGLKKICLLSEYFFDIR